MRYKWIILSLVFCVIPLVVMGLTACERTTPPPSLNKQIPTDKTAAKNEFDRIRKQLSTSVKTDKSEESTSNIEKLYLLTQGPLKSDASRHFDAAQRMAVLYFDRKEMDRAAAYLNEALVIAESQRPAEHPEGGSWTSWQAAQWQVFSARLYTLQEKGKGMLARSSNDARIEFENVISLSRNAKYATPDHLAELALLRGESLMFVAITYQREQRFYEALAYLERARPDYIFFDASAQCRFHAGEAACYMGLEQNAIALEELNEAIGIAKQANLKDLVPTLTLTYAQLSLQSRKNAIPSDTPTVSDKNPSTINLPKVPEFDGVLSLTQGLLQFVSGNDDEAEKVFTKGLKEAQSNHWSSIVAACEGSLGDIALRRGNIMVASEHYRTANDIFEQETLFSGDGTMIGSIQQASANFPAHYANVLIKQNKKIEALSIVDRARGRGLMQLASSRNQVYVGPIPVATIAEMQRLRRVYLEAEDSFRKKPEDETFSKRAAAKSSWERYVSDLPIRFPEYSKWQKEQYLKKPRTTVQTLQNLVARNVDTLYIHIDTVDDDTTLLFILSAKSGTQVFLLPMGTKQWNTLVADWNESIDAEGRKYSDLTKIASSQALAGKEPERARSLYDALFGPIEKAGGFTGIRHVVIVPDSALWNAPFAALIDTKGRRLIDRFPISVAVSLLQASNENKRIAADNVGKIPMYYVANPPLPKDNKDNLKSLELAAETARRIAKKLPRAQGIEGQDAKEDRITPYLSEADVVLFATHGFLIKPTRMGFGLGEEANNGLDSYLLLAPAGPGSTSDGHLNGRDLLNLSKPISARMVILMACSSGAGIPAGGEGLMGLVWSFWGAGCPSVVASGWSVDQAASSQLIEGFWNALRDPSPSGKPIAKDEALQIAIKGMRAKQKRYASPYYWAAFQVYGSIKPL